MINDILSLSPYLEVIIRKIYWKSPIINNILIQFKKRKPNRNLCIMACASKSISVNSFSSFLRTCGVKEGDLLIVHSSMSRLKNKGLDVNEVIESLLNSIGPNGTLAAPAFPKYDEPVGINRIHSSADETVSVYDRSSTIPWTGLLPQYLMNRPDSIRSLHPLNSMVAVGPKAISMMENNIAGDDPLPCGPQSSWKFCLDNNAKIIAIGADMAHSLTMIHVAEDCFEAVWPIPKWYRKRKFYIINNSYKFYLTVRERHPKWAMCYAERTLAKDLAKKGIQKDYNYYGVSIGLIEAQKLISFLNERKATGYPYYLWRNEAR